FDDVPEKLVDLGIRAFDFAPTMAEAHRRGLFAQVGELAAGDFVLIQTRGAGLGTGIKRKIIRANRFPIVGALVERVDVELRVARSVTKRRDDGIEIGLAGTAAHGGDGAVGDVDSGIGSFQHGGGVDAAGVMRVKVDRNADFVAESFHQFERGIRFAKSRHILYGQEVGAQFFQLLGHRDVILERIFRAAFVENVAGVANGGFTDGAGFERGIDRDAHVFDGIKRIENAKDVDALGMCFANKFNDEIVGIGSVADSVGAAEEHLETDVRNAIAQVRSEEHTSELQSLRHL